MLRSNEKNERDYFDMYKKVFQPPFLESPSQIRMSEHLSRPRQRVYRSESEDDRSTDGSDTEGSLVDFIVKDEEDNSDAESLLPDNLDEKTEVQLLREEFPYDKRLLEETTSTGPRRSKRQRRSVTRYQDPDFGKLMYDDVDSDEVNRPLTSSDNDSESAFENDSGDDSGDSSDEDVEETREGDFAYDD